MIDCAYLHSHVEEGNIYPLQVRDIFFLSFFSSFSDIILLIKKQLFRVFFFFLILQAFQKRNFTQQSFT